MRKTLALLKIPIPALAITLAALLGPALADAVSPASEPVVVAALDVDDPIQAPDLTGIALNEIEPVPRQPGMSGHVPHASTVHPLTLTAGTGIKEDLRFARGTIA